MSYVLTSYVTTFLLGAVVAICALRRDLVFRFADWCSDVLDRLDLREPRSSHAARHGALRVVSDSDLQGQTFRNVRVLRPPTDSDGITDPEASA